MDYSFATPVRNPLPAVILAAGRGARLRSGVPKPMTEVAGRSLLRRVLDTCVEAGVGRVVFALGYEADQLERHARDTADQLGLAIDCVRASDWEKGNGVSARAAARAADASHFYLLMGDHIVAPGVLEALAASPPPRGGVALAVDLDPAAVHDLDDATKVRVRGEHFEAIGKTLDDWNGVDTGAFLCTQGVVIALDEAQRRGGYQLSDGIRTLAGARLARAVDVTGMPWIDVDTLDALQEAERRMRPTIGAAAR